MRKIISITRQFVLLSVNRSSLYYEKKGIKEEDLKIMRAMDEQYLKTPFYGRRKMTMALRVKGFRVSEKKVARLMKKMGISAIYPTPRTSIPGKNHKIYPYLLKDLEITRPNQVWCSDITYIPMSKGFMYLCVIMDWYSRKVLSWSLSNTLDTEFCITCLKRALFSHGRPEIFNSDQGSQYTSNAFVDILKEKGIKISMDGKGRYRDNIFVERLWRSLKQEFIYICEFKNARELREGLKTYFEFYNQERFHQSLDNKTPDEVYEFSKAA